MFSRDNWRYVLRRDRGERGHIEEGERGHVRKERGVTTTVSFLNRLK